MLWTKCETGGGSSKMVATQKMATGSGPMLTRTGANTPPPVIKIRLQCPRVQSSRISHSLTLVVLTSLVSLIITIQLMRHILDLPGCCGQTPGSGKVVSDNNSFCPIFEVPLLLGVKFHTILGTEFSAVQFSICLVWLAKFSIWFKIDMEIEEDKYFGHGIFKHSDKYFYCHGTLKTPSSCGNNSNMDSRIPKKIL